MRRKNKDPKNFQNFAGIICLVVKDAHLQGIEQDADHYEPVKPFIPDQNGYAPSRFGHVIELATKRGFSTLNYSISYLKLPRKQLFNVYALDFYLLVRFIFDIIEIDLHRFLMHFFSHGTYGIPPILRRYDI